MDELDRRRRRRLLEIARTFNEDVPVLQLLDELPCIASKSTREKIINRARHEDTAEANRLLCSSLTGRTGWYDQLVRGLDAVDCKEIAEMMRRDSEGNSLESDRPSSSPTFSALNSRRVPNPMQVDAPHWNQRQDVRMTPPSIPVERHISMGTTVPHFPIGIKKALEVLDLPNGGGLSNNWETLADSLDVTWEQSNRLEVCSNPTTRIINAWYEKHPDHATLGKLLQKLEEIERPDVISEIRKVIGWEEGGLADGSLYSVHRPVPDPTEICHSLEKRPQYNNNLFGGERSSFNREEPRTTRSLPLDLKDQHQQLEKCQTEFASEGSSLRDGKQLSKKMNNQPLDPPGASAMPSSLLDKSQKRQTNNQDFPGKKVADLSKEIQGAPPQDRLQPGYDFGKKGLHEDKVKGQRSKFTEEVNKDVPKKMNDPQLPATENSYPPDWSKNRERMERSNLRDPLRESQENPDGEIENSDQAGELFAKEPQSGLFRRKPVSGFPRSSKAGSGELPEKPPHIPSREETSKVNVESSKEKLDNRVKAAESGTKSKTTDRGEASVQDKVRQAEDGQNDLEMESPEGQPDERTLNPNIMTADSRRGTESKNYTLFQKKQMCYHKKQTLKELSLPSQMASVPAQNPIQDTPVENGISDSPAHTLVSFETPSISASDILESLEESLNDGEPAKLTTVVKDSCNKEKLEDEDREEINFTPRLEAGRSPGAVKKVNKSPLPNVSQTMPQEPLHSDTKNTDAKKNVGVKVEGGEETCSEQGKQKLGNDCKVDKPRIKAEQGNYDGKGRVEVEHYHKGFHGESQGIHGDNQSIHGNSKGIHGDSQGFHGDNKDNKDGRNLEDCAEAMGGCHVKSNSSKENVLITHDFTNHVFDSSHTEMGQGMTRPTVSTVGDKGINDLDQHGEVELGSVSKNPQLISKDFTMLEKKQDSRHDVMDDCLVEKEEIQQRYEVKEDMVGGNDGPSVRQSQKVGGTSASPKPLRNQEPEESEVSAETNHWGNSLVTRMASSVLCYSFGNHLNPL